jgi:hypothetical protein
MLTPLVLPPGRARLATRPLPTMSSVHEGGKGRLDFVACAGVEGLDLQSDRARSFRYLSKRSLEAPSIAWIDQHGNSNGLGHQFAQQPKPLGPHLRDEKIDASRVAPGARKAGDKTQLDRVFTDTEDDSFGCKRSRIANCSDNCYAAAYEVGHERRQAIVLAAEPVVLDDHVLILYVARFGEAFTKRGCMACGTIE